MKSNTLKTLLYEQREEHDERDLGPEKHPSGFLDESLRRELAAILPSSVAPLLAALDKAVRTLDRREVARQAHSVNSATCYFDSPGLTRACARLEALAATADPPALAEAHHEIMVEYARLLNQIARC